MVIQEVSERVDTLRSRDANVLLPTVLLLWVLVVPGHAAQCVPWNASAELAEDLLIGSIFVRVGDLFDPTIAQERRLVHSTANALHIRTRESTIINALPFVTGEVYHPDKLAEAERILRSKRYLRHAKVLPVQRCGNDVDVSVSTVDNWTLTPSISFGSAGGVNRYSTEIQDLNVLGLGKELKFRIENSGDEQVSSFLYNDDNLLGSRYQLRLEVGDTNDGRTYSLQTGLPFYSAVADTSWLLSVKSDVSSYEPGKGWSTNQELAASQAVVETDRVDFRVARSIKARRVNYARLGGGIRIERQRTQLPDDAGEHRDAFDFTENYPFIYARWSRDDWQESTHYESLGRVEDINLGLGVGVEAGLLIRSLDNEHSGLRLAGSLSKGWRASDYSLHRLLHSQVHYVDRSPETKYAVAFRYQYFRWLNEVNQLDIRLVTEEQRGYSPIADYRVGGEYGLKGYPNAYRQGEQRLYAVSEVRHVTRWNPWRLLRSAWTIFAEAGRVSIDEVDSEILIDVGVGISLAPTRSSSADVFRFDIAVPLTARREIDAVQFFIGSRIAY